MKIDFDWFVYCTEFSLLNKTTTCNTISNLNFQYFWNLKLDSKEKRNSTLRFEFEVIITKAVPILRTGVKMQRYNWKKTFCGCSNGS